MIRTFVIVLFTSMLLSFGFTLYALWATPRESNVDLNSYVIHRM